MTKTFRDWGTLGALNTTPDIDLTELPPRLGSPATLRRTGRVMVYDGFENLGAWLVTAGVGGSAAVDATFTFRSSSLGNAVTPASLKIIGGSANGNITTVARNFPFMILNRIGVEVTFAPGPTFDGKLEVDLEVISPVVLGNRYTSTVGFNFSTNVLYYTGFGGTTNLYTYTKYARKTPPSWLNLKFGFNINAGVQNLATDRVYFQDQFFNGILMPGVNADSGHLIRANLRAICGATVSQPVWVDDFIFTADEP